MDFSQEKILELIKSNLLIVILFSLGLISLGIGLTQLFSANKNDISFEKASENTSSSSKNIAIDVEGAVLNPGVYSLSPEARVKDALVAAGGLSSDADRSYISQKINLAKKVADGEKIYIPKAGEKVAGTTSGSKININNSSLSELDSLPGIGSVTGQKIIDGRPYSSPQELIDRKAVSQATFEKIKDLIEL